MQTTPLSCQEFVELVTEYLERVLAPAVQALCESHVAACSLCRAYLDQMRQTVRALGALIETSSPPPVRAELLEVFRAWKDGHSPGPVP